MAGLGIMKIVAIVMVSIIMVGGVSVLLNDVNPSPSTFNTINGTCQGGGGNCYSNISIYSNRSFFNSTANPFLHYASNSINQSNNLNAQSATSGFSFAFIPNDLGLMLTAIIQAPKILALVLSYSLNNVGGGLGQTSIDGVPLTLMIVAYSIALITIYIVGTFLSAWIKFPIV